MQPPVSQPARTPLIAPWVAIAVLGVVSCLLALWSDHEDTKPCGVVGECLGNALTAGLIALAIPVVVSAGLLVLRFPGRDHLLQLLFIPLAWLNRDLMKRLAEWGAGFTAWDPPVPWWAWLATLPVLLAVSWLAVRRTPTPLWLRIVAPAVTAALLLVGSLWSIAPTVTTPRGCWGTSRWRSTCRAFRAPRSRWSGSRETW